MRWIERRVSPGLHSFGGDTSGGREPVVEFTGDLLFSKERLANSPGLKGQVALQAPVGLKTGVVRC
jgi:hypothetical protein